MSLLSRKQEKDGAEYRSDEAVLGAARRDPAQFAVLLDRYQAAFLRKAQAVVREREEAEDVVQETFTKIYRKAHLFQPQEGASFKSWAYKVLMNTAFTHYQQKRKERDARAPRAPEAFENMADSAENGFVRNEERNYVRSILALLPRQFARVLRLHFLEGRSQEEVADIEGVSVSAVKTRVHRAKKQFREAERQRMNNGTLTHSHS